MPPTSDSLSSASLPFGADTHTHATWRRSGSVSVVRSVRHEYQPTISDHGLQTYSAVVADALASDAVSRLANTQIPPSSIKSIPRSHKRVLRRHRILFWVVVMVFHVSLIALTAAIILGAVKAHESGQNDVKCAAIIVGVFGFSGMIGSAAVIWLILTGRKERARLEKRWTDDERAKEANCIRERRSERHLRQVIRDRERSLSRSRSRGEDRDRITRPAFAKVPSFRAMESASISPAQMPDYKTQPMSKRTRSPWPSPMDVSDDNDDDLDDAIDQEKNQEIRQEPKQENKQKPNNESNHESNQEANQGNDQEKSHENDDVRNDNWEKDENDGGHEKEGKAPATRNLRVSASTTFEDLDALDTENDENDEGEIISRPSIALPEQTVLSKVSPSLNDTKPLPALPESGQTSPIPLNITSTYINSSSTGLHPTAPGFYKSLRYPPYEQTPMHPATMHSRNPAPSNVQGDAITPLRIYGWGDGGLGSAQSDDNFQAMLDLEDDAGSEDERDRQLRRQKSLEKVERWASTFDSEAVGEDREQKGKRLREAVERGLRRVAMRKKERRQAAVTAERTEGFERRIR